MAQILVNEIDQKVIVRSAGAPGKTIISGSGVPTDSIGVPGDFYYDITTTRFYGPKSSLNTWTGVNNFLLNKPTSHTQSWELSQLTHDPGGLYSIVINHNLEFYPNASVKSSAGDELEIGITYNNINSLTLTMAQPFSGTVYLS